MTQILTVLESTISNNIIMILKLRPFKDFAYQLTLSLLITSLPVGEHFEHKRVKKVSPSRGVGSGPDDCRRQTRCSIRWHRSQIWFKFKQAMVILQEMADNRFSIVFKYQSFNRFPFLPLPTLSPFPPVYPFPKVKLVNVC